MKMLFYILMMLIYCLHHIKENLARNNIEIDHFEFKIAYNGIEFVYLKGIAFDTNGDTIKNFQTVAEYSKKVLLLSNNIKIKD